METNESINVKYHITDDCDGNPALYLYNVDATDQGGGFDLDMLDEFIRFLQEQREHVNFAGIVRNTEVLFEDDNEEEDEDPNLPVTRLVAKPMSDGDVVDG